MAINILLCTFHILGYHFSHLINAHGRDQYGSVLQYFPPLLIKRINKEVGKLVALENCAVVYNFAI